MQQRRQEPVLGVGAAKQKTNCRGANVPGGNS